MEIKLKKLSYKNYFRDLTVTLTDNHIIGVMGKNYSQLLYLIGNDNISSKHILFNNLSLGNKKSNYIGYIDKKNNFYTAFVYDEILLYLNRYLGRCKDIEKRILKTLDMLDVDKDFLKKRISELSNSEKRLLKYILMLIYNPNVIVIDEPYLFLDFRYKKIINNVLYTLKNKYKKTIIIGSCNSNIIYSLCELSLLVNRNNHLYGVTKTIFNENELHKFGINVPDLVKFSDLVRKKGINIGYFQDIRDLIKDVYRNV